MRIAAALLLMLPAIAPAQQIGVGEYNLLLGPNGVFPGPYGIAAGPDGAIWFTEYWANSIGRITPAGSITVYPVNSQSNCHPNYITAGPDGALWFSETCGQIGRITTTGAVTEYPGANGDAITTGPDGALWFTNSSSIGRMTTAGAITEYSLPTINAVALGITAGPDGALWFTEYSATQIGRITTDGSITEYPAPQAYGLSGIAAGPDGALWSTATVGDLIVRTTTAGQSTEYSVPEGLLYPFGITAGPDGAMWFTGNGNLGRINMGGTITEYPVPPPVSAFENTPNQITVGHDGELWFTGGTGGLQIGEAVFETADLAVNPPNGYYKSNLTFTGSGYSPNENVQIYISGVGSAIMASPVTDSTGSFSATVRAPQSPMGPRIFLAVGQSSRKLGAANFSMAPILILTPSSGAVGSIVKAEGYGFGWPTGVDIYWDNPRTLIGAATPNTYGTFNGSAAVTFKVPADAAAGKNGVFGRDINTGAIGPGFFDVQ
ncbi:MAG: hypothetical protein ABSH32_28550 [Bryobacteraceae bacterium]|jgi:virginiamycin B lyase